MASHYFQLKMVLGQQFKSDIFSGGNWVESSQLFSSVSPSSSIYYRPYSPWLSPVNAPMTAATTALMGKENSSHFFHQPKNSGIQSILMEWEQQRYIAISTWNFYERYIGYVGVKDLPISCPAICCAT